VRRGGRGGFRGDGAAAGDRPAFRNEIVRRQQQPAEKDDKAERIAERTEKFHYTFHRFPSSAQRTIR
jgi:hypothetical protein